MHFIYKIAITLILFPLIISGLQAQSYFEYQLHDPAVVKISDKELGTLYDKKWYLISIVEDRLGCIYAPNPYSGTIIFSWKGEISSNVTFRVIENKFILIEDKSKYKHQLAGLHSISKFSDSLIVLTENFTSDYKWNRKYTLTTNNKALLQEDKKDSIRRQEDKEFVLKERVGMDQKDALYLANYKPNKLPSEPCQKDGFHKPQKIVSDSCINGQIETDTTFTKDGVIKRITITYVIVKEGLKKTYKIIDEKSDHYNYYYYDMDSNQLVEMEDSEFWKVVGN